MFQWAHPCSAHPSTACSFCDPSFAYTKQIQIQAPSHLSTVIAFSHLWACNTPGLYLDHISRKFQHVFPSLTWLFLCSWVTSAATAIVQSSDTPDNQSSIYLYFIICHKYEWKRYERGTCRCKWRSLHACRECQIPTWSQKILKELCCKRVLLNLFNWHSVFREEWEILQDYKNLSLVTIVSFTGDSLYSQLEKERWKRTSCHREVCEPKSPKSIHSQNAKRERWPTWGIRANPSGS